MLLQKAYKFFISRHGSVSPEPEVVVLLYARDRCSCEGKVPVVGNTLAKDLTNNRLQAHLSLCIVCNHTLVTVRCCTILLISRVHVMQNAKHAQIEPAGVFVDCTGKLAKIVNGQRITFFAGVVPNYQLGKKGSREGVQPLMLFLAA